MKISNKRASILNSLSSILYQVIIASFSIVNRSFFLQYFGVELLGLSSTFSAIITITSLAETGLGSCVIYRLYKALQKEDNEEINDLVNIARAYLSTIGIIIIIIAFLFIPLLRFVITGITLDFNIYVYFILQVFSTAFSYFGSYKRLLLTADKRDFVGKITDAGCNVVFSLLKIIVCIYMQDYFLYLVLSWIQVVISNIIIQAWCQKLYPFLILEKADLRKIKEMWPDMKNLFWGGVAAYLFSSADNLILSVGVSTVAVGYLGNYTTITTTLKTFILNLLLFMGPIIGNEVASPKGETNKTNDYLRFYDFSLHLVSVLLLVPETVLIQDFVESIWGREYILNMGIVVLIVIDQYITIVQDSNGVFMSVTGRFKELKVADGIAAMLNIILSVFFCKLIGLAGILLGTVVSRGVQWAIKAYYARKTAILYKYNATRSYIFRIVKETVLFVLLIVINRTVYSIINIESFWIRFIVGGVISAVMSGGIVLVCGMVNGDTKIIYKLIRKT